MSDDLVDELVRATTTVGEHYYAAAARQGLTVQEARLLFILSTQPTNMLGLSGALDVAKSTLTGLIARMESAGLIERERGPADRRNLVATPTARGRAAAADFARDLASRVEGVLGSARLSDSARAELAKILSTMLESAESAER